MGNRERDDLGISHNIPQGTAVVLLYLIFNKITGFHDAKLIYVKNIEKEKKTCLPQSYHFSLQMKKRRLRRNIVVA